MSGIGLVNLEQDRLRKVDAIDAPTALRRYLRRSVVEVLIVRLKESIIDIVELVDTT
jgi:hypothetical protein